MDRTGRRSAHHFDDTWFQSADQHENGVLVRRGRPPLDNPKHQITVRLDADLVARLRESGPGWQTRMNDLLRKAVGL